MNKHVLTWREAQKRKLSEERVFCSNWNPSIDDGPQTLRGFDYGRAELRVLGSLIPVDEELVANSPGIQSWSKAGGTRSGRPV